jgi:hypothetical protein
LAIEGPVGKIIREFCDPAVTIQFETALPVAVVAVRAV